MDKAHHPKDDVSRLHIKRKKGGRRLISMEACVEDTIAGLHRYVQNSQEKLLSAAWRSSGEREVAEPPKITKQRQQIKRKQDLKNKILHDQFIRDTDGIADVKSWNWQWNDNLKRKTESLITSAQDQCIRTNNIKTKIDGTRNDPKCKCVKPMIRQSLTLFLNVLNLFIKNTNNNMTGWEGLCIGIFVERKALMFSRNGMNTDLYLYRK